MDGRNRLEKNADASTAWGDARGRRARWRRAGSIWQDSHRLPLPAFPDVRSNNLLQGLERCEISEEHFDKPYREATIQVTPMCATEGLAKGVRQALVDVLGRYLQAREDSAAWQGFFREEVSDEVLVNTLSTYLDCTPLEKQFLLEADGLHQRARRLNDLVQFMLHEPHGIKGLD